MIEALRSTSSGPTFCGWHCTSLEVYLSDLLLNTHCTPFTTTKKEKLRDFSCGPVMLCWLLRANVSSGWLNGIILEEPNALRRNSFFLLRRLVMYKNNHTKKAFGLVVEKRVWIGHIPNANCRIVAKVNQNWARITIDPSVTPALEQQLTNHT